MTVSVVGSVAPLARVEPNEPSDAELIARFAAGDVDALALLYDRHRSSAYGVALRITRERSLAEDAVQNAFISLWRNPHAYRADRGSVRTWLLAIVRNRSIDLLRHQRPVSELPAEGVTPAILIQPDIWHDVAEVLDREAIEMAYFSGLTQLEIAGRTGAPLGTVKSRVRLGLLTLRSAMTSEAAGQR